MQPTTLQDQAFDWATGALNEVVFCLHHLEVLRSTDMNAEDNKNDAKRHRFYMHNHELDYDSNSKQLSIRLLLPDPINQDDPTAIIKFLRFFAEANPLIASFDEGNNTFTLNIEQGMDAFKKAYNTELLKLKTEWLKNLHVFPLQAVINSQLDEEVPSRLPALREAVEKWITTVPPNDNTKKNTDIRAQLAVALQLIGTVSTQKNYSFLTPESKALLTSLTAIFNEWLDPYRYRLNRCHYQWDIDDLPRSLYEAVAPIFEHTINQLSEGIERSVYALSDKATTKYSRR